MYIQNENISSVVVIKKHLKGHTFQLVAVYFKQIETLFLTKVCSDSVLPVFQSDC